MGRLNVLKAGDGPQVLFLHGIGSSATAWQDQMARLSPHYRCLAPDMPGYGESSPLQQGGLDAILEAVMPVLEERPTHIVGVSFGALLALAFARRAPALVRSLVLSDATLGRANMPAMERERWLEGRRMLADVLQTRADARAAEIAAPGAPATVVAEIARHMRRAGPEGYRAVAEAIAATDARPWLATMTQPTLVLCGEQDQVTGAEVSRLLAETLPDARLKIVPGAGHAPHLEQATVFAAEVEAFLAKLGQPSALG